MFLFFLTRFDMVVVYGLKKIRMISSRVESKADDDEGPELMVDNPDFPLLSSTAEERAPRESKGGIDNFQGGI